METNLEFTGERFLPEISGQIAFEHLHRYHFAKNLVKNCRVLDVACGEGYGSWILSSSALDVVGVDIAPDAIAHALSKYADSGISFVEASATKLPFDDDRFDAVVSFETIEHLEQHHEMISEIKRVLKKEGILIISSPNKKYYSVEPRYENPFHVRELFREEFVSLAKLYFSNVILFGQRVVHGSLMVIENDHGTIGFESLLSDGSNFNFDDGLSKPLYDLLVATNAILPAVKNSLFEASVHDLDPAQFYGVHLPERVFAADAKILELQQLIAQQSGLLQQQLSELRAGIARADFTRLSLENEITSLRLKFADTDSALCISRATVNDLSQTITELQVNLETSQNMCAEKDAGFLSLQAHTERSRKDFEGQLSTLLTELGETRIRAQQENRRADVLDMTLLTIYRSTSWRVTTPLRWAKSTWMRIVHE